MSNRKMATIRRIKELLPIQNADKIELAAVGGWQVVVEKGLHKAGDFVVYCEIDSWIPHELAPFLSKNKEPREFNGVKGEKLRTIKLRGTLSQGLILPLSILESVHSFEYESDFGESIEITYSDLLLDAWFDAKTIKGKYEVITPVYKSQESFYKDVQELQLDLSEILRIQKWEAPIPAQLSGKIKGNFPDFIRKTDQERIQNVWDEYKKKYNNLEFEVTLKMDGTSFTAYYNNGAFGVCSRNYELYEDDSSYWKAAKRSNLENLLKSYGKNIAIQAELIGEGIQGNPEKIKDTQLRVFDIYSIEEQRYLTPKERWEVLDVLDPEGIYLGCCPTLDNNEFHDNLSTSITLREFKNIEDILKYAEGDSEYSNCREGLVFKSMELIEGQVLSFKVISNKFLEKNQ